MFNNKLDEVSKKELFRKNILNEVSDEELLIKPKSVGREVWGLHSVGREIW